MFTGLIEQTASVLWIRATDRGTQLRIAAPGIAETARTGDSIAINGCCLTVVEHVPAGFAFEAGPETLERTNLGELTAGSPVNLEPSLRVGDRLGGHFVSGHIEGTGKLVERVDDREWSTLWFSFPRELGRYMVAKGSIAVDGVSLTLVDVEADRFSVALIPHTLEATTLGKLKLGDRVNLETDLLAKYAKKQLADIP